METSCHCGAVRIAVARAPDDLNECLCSICRRYAARWAYYRRAEAVVTGGPLNAYEWGRRTLAFHRCSGCGCVTHWTSNDPDRDTVGVNAWLFDPSNIADVPVHHSDGP